MIDFGVEVVTEWVASIFGKASLWMDLVTGENLVMFGVEKGHQGGRRGQVDADRQVEE